MPATFHCSCRSSFDRYPGFLLLADVRHVHSDPHSLLQATEFLSDVKAPSMLSIPDLLTLLQHADLVGSLDLTGVVVFLDIISRLSPLIHLPSSRRHAETLPPLPSNICDALSVRLQLSNADVLRLWHAVGAVALSSACTFTEELHQLDGNIASIASSHELGSRPRLPCLVLPSG